MFLIFHVCSLHYFSAITCDEPPSLHNGYFNPPETNTYHSIITYSCMPGYWLEKYVYDVTLICDVTEKWTPNITECIG